MALGDQIYVYRPLINLDGIYQHHGIDCGDGSVIHYRKPSEIVEQTSFKTFTRGNRVYVREYLEGFCFIPDIVVQRAANRLGEQKYNLLFNNCEHFATWCKTGIADSQQIRDFIPIITRLNAANLHEPLQRALQGADPKNAAQLLNEALADIREVWDDLQPQYREAVREKDIWQRVAVEALKKEREDLARAALQRKVSYQRRAEELQSQLQQLGVMTEGVLKDLAQAGS